MGAVVIDFQPTKFVPTNTSAAWVAMSGTSTQTITTLTDNVLVDATLSCSLEAGATGEDIGIRLGISLDGGSTYDYSVEGASGYLMQNDEGASSFARFRFDVRHVVAGTLTDDLIIKAEYSTNASYADTLDFLDVRGFAYEVPVISSGAGTSFTRLVGQPGQLLITGG